MSLELKTSNFVKVLLNTQWINIILTRLFNMKKLYLVLITLVATATTSWAQVNFEPHLEFGQVPNLLPETVVMPVSPLNFQVLFIGSTDTVQTTATYGNEAGTALAKEWHDFIGVTMATDEEKEAKGEDFVGWISVNHEMRLADDRIGDGGGMTAFAVRRDMDADTLIIMEQTLEDGRSGKFFNVDFVNTVGETGMNCGGIIGPDGRIWTAEEWFVDDMEELEGWGTRDTSDFIIGETAPNGFPGFDGMAIKRFENWNWMVEIDPREAVAVRKQYNWGRQPFEGGVVMPDNQTVYTGGDATPGFLSKFVADEPGDFTSGTLFVYKHDAEPKWVEIDNTDLDKMLNFSDEAVAVGATMFNRLEWLALNPLDSTVYIAETGRDFPGSRWAGELADGAVFAPHHLDRAAEQSAISGEPVSPDSASYWDFYGRVLEFDPSTDEVSVFLEGGHTDPAMNAQELSFANYPDRHLSNPDGLSVMVVNPDTDMERAYLLVNEDLNGTSFGRMPRGMANRTCELWLLDLEVENPTVADLIRITAVPLGAEVTGAAATTDGRTLLVNSQHPSSDNPFPFNHSLTFAISGWSDAAMVTSNNAIIPDQAEAFSIYPNPVSRTVFFDEITDVALYDMTGKRIKVKRNTKSINVSDLTAGTYVIMNKEGLSRKLVIQ